MGPVRALIQCERVLAAAQKGRCTRILQPMAEIASGHGAHAIEHPVVVRGAFRADQRQLSGRGAESMSRHIITVRMDDRIAQRVTDNRRMGDKTGQAGGKLPGEAAMPLYPRRRALELAGQVHGGAGAPFRFDRLDDLGPRGRGLQRAASGQPSAYIIGDRALIVHSHLQQGLGCLRLQGRYPRRVPPAMHRLGSIIDHPDRHAAMHHPKEARFPIRAAQNR